MKQKMIPRLFMAALFVPCVMFMTGTPASADKLDDIKAAISKKGARWSAGDTSVSKLTDQEKKRRLGLIKPKETDLAGPEVANALSLEAPLANLPASLDWRANGGYYVTPVKNQGSCGSCWAFATTAALESYNLIRDNTPGLPDDRAEEILLSCAGAGSCSGGYVSSASSYIRDTGLPNESSFPYTSSSTDDKCSNALPGWESLTSRIDSWIYVTTYSPTVDAIKDALYSHGPLVSTMDVYNDFYSYKTGVYEFTTGSYLGGHAILIVGYNDDESVDGGGYFIVKNSWGTSWGEAGYFNIAYSQISSPIYFGSWTIAYKQPSQPATPAAPGNLTASPVSSSQVNLQWTDNATNEEGFEVERCTGSGCSNFTLVSTVGANSTSWSNTGLAGNTTYMYRVRAYNSEGDSSYSNTSAATTQAIQRSLAVAKSGTGSGTVTGTGINCGTDCSEVYADGTSVVLTASASTGSSITSWTGCNVANGNTCTAIMSENKSVTANFSLNRYTLTVAKSGTGSGTVTGSGISCGGDCSESYGYGTSVTLTTTPDTFSTFTGWTGCDSTSGSTCTVTLSSNKSVNASFARNKRPIKIVKSGKGTGSVTGTGISCGTDCSEDYSDGTSVTLTATPDPGSVFTGWSGSGCSGTGVCEVTIEGAPIDITATFSLMGSLSVDTGTVGTRITIAGSGHGARKGKVLVGTIPTKIISWNDSSIVFEITQPLQPGPYDVVVKPRDQQLTTATGTSDVFTVTEPEILSLDIDSGSPGDLIEVSGMYFGSKKGKVYLEDQESGHALHCRVISWSMNPTSGKSTVIFAVPKPTGYVAGNPTTYTLKVINKIGSTSMPFTINYHNGN